MFLKKSESLAFESAIQLKESRIRLTIGIRNSNPSSADKESGIQDFLALPNVGPKTSERDIRDHVTFTFNIGDGSIVSVLEARRLS